jgi:3-hydroxyisobutyrate dehydrogenase-like beta-hydroxyacid dehydrogenase
MSKIVVGILHPGSMGISVAATVRNSGHDVFWASSGRSEETRQRAGRFDLVDAGDLQTLCSECAFLVSVCPPHAAETVADAVLESGFQGMYLDANAISPQKARRIESKLQARGIDFIDGGIIGGPAWEAGRTWLYLSGQKAEQAAALFDAGPLEVEVISPEAGKASALKMCFAANTKGSTALLSLVVAAAEGLGVRDDLERQWSRRDENAIPHAHRRVRNVTAKAWRFAGEMEEMVETFEAIGLPGGFHAAAADLYRRIADFKGAEDMPSLDEVLSALLHEE